MHPTNDRLKTLVEHCEYLSITSSDLLYPESDPSQALTLLQVNSPQCEAVIALQGAQLLSHRAEGGHDLLWLSPIARFAPGKAIRGGIPLCLPWFGRHSDNSKPQHGFARTQEWQLSQADYNHKGQVELSWELNNYSDTPHPMFAWRFRARLTMKLGRAIEMGLTVTNLDSRPMPLSWAMHSYHPVHNLGQVRISGLSDCDYLDNTCALERFTQRGDVVFNGELDRIYLSVAEVQVIHTQPSVVVKGTNCHSAIVWNPGPEKAAGMTDIGAEHYTEFVCLERGNTADNGLSVEPGKSHHARIDISLGEV